MRDRGSRQTRPQTPTLTSIRSDLNRGRLHAGSGHRNPVDENCGTSYRVEAGGSESRNSGSNTREQGGSTLDFRFKCHEPERARHSSLISKGQTEAGRIAACPGKELGNVSKLTLDCKRHRGIISLLNTGSRNHVRVGSVCYRYCFNSRVNSN